MTIAQIRTWHCTGRTHQRKYFPPTQISVFQWMDFLVGDNGKAEGWLNGFYGSSFELHPLYVDCFNYAIP